MRLRSWIMAGIAACLSLHAGVTLAVVIIDDFSSGGLAPAIVGITGLNDPNTWYDAFQSGGMVGGQREVVLETVAVNSSTATSEIAVQNGLLDVDGGFDVLHRLNLRYGKSPGGNAPLGLDLSGADRIRIEFDHASADLNLHVTLFNGNTPRWSISGGTLASTGAFYADLVFADGVLGAAPGVTDFDFTDISYLFVQTQSNSQHGADDFAISRILALRAVPEPATVLLLVAAGGVAACRRRRRGSGLYSRAHLDYR
ncbi:MAG: PEP-CTERM sorting domain-containing protein [Gammaproteobacteria bacterium]